MTDLMYLFLHHPLFLLKYTFVVMGAWFQSIFDDLLPVFAPR